ncbi:TPA: transketolase [Candidatus Saccharibacteria bacterium]|nr:MAG: tktB protein [Candidatus Saccharibacteria bacterium GW2011_GWC2_44_17]MBH1956159.1 transketolase [Candidatus Saccharibacteria bacterium]OGL23521.1 MAG: transketolase [Candidatus Saccharibacteria bacterium RIFCSPHIGHO2_01_FULL_46_30]OGL33228.1 MAG: transketolase [Candidatus Saccharibacteria bacterium RIFCSPHIGHO2_12_FULL_47_16]MBH1972547.1 transketolase [Candidatus Saccharibacteria bacterium]
MRGQLTVAQVEQKAAHIREDIIRMLENAGSGHSAGPLGMADMLAALYFHIMRLDPKNPEWEDRDVFFLSNGHTVPVQYAAMAEAGYFEKDELMTLRKLGSRLQGHPERTKLPGLENTSGPLGSGLSQAAGYAYSLQYLDKQQHRFVYTIMGDGELNEGNIWEAAMFAGKYKLSQLVGFIDRNNIQIDGTTEEVMPLEDLRGKWESFGWHVQEVDGHNVESIIDAASMARAITNKPSVIIAHTIPGKGVDFMEYDYHWHGMAPNSEQAKIALKKLRTLNGKITSGENE